MVRHRPGGHTYLWGQISQSLHRRKKGVRRPHKYDFCRRDILPFVPIAVHAPDHNDRGVFYPSSTIRQFPVRACPPPEEIVPCENLLTSEKRHVIMHADRLRGENAMKI